MVLKITFEEALKSGYLYTYGSIALGTVLFSLFLGKYLLSFVLFCALVPYVIGVFSATQQWEDSKKKNLRIDFPFGQSGTVFTNIQTQLLCLFISVCFLSITAIYFFEQNYHICVVTSMAIFFVMVHQMLLIAAINRTSCIFCLPLFLISTSILGSWSIYKEKYEDSVLSSLDFNGIKIQNPKISINIKS